MGLCCVAPGACKQTVVVYRPTRCGCGVGHGGALLRPRALIPACGVSTRARGNSTTMSGPVCGGGGGSLPVPGRTKCVVLSAPGGRRSSPGHQTSTFIPAEPVPLYPLPKAGPIITMARFAFAAVAVSLLAVLSGAHGAGRHCCPPSRAASHHERAQEPAPCARCSSARLCRTVVQAANGYRGRRAVN